MPLLAVILLIVTLLRTGVTQYLHIPPAVFSHQWLLLPDLLFAAGAAFWFLRKKKVNLVTAIYVIIFFGSLLWDYSPLFIPIKLSLPILIILDAYKKRAHKFHTDDIAYILFLFLMYPLHLLSVTRDYIQGKKKDNTVEAEETINLKKPIIAGLGIGAAILLSLVALDQEFATFLSFFAWWDAVIRLVFSFAYYLFTFGWFFAGVATFTAPERSDKTHHVVKLLQAALTITVGIIIGYTLYDGYILLRAAQLIQLVFESVGKNTQLYYIELVGLGGGLLIVASYVLDWLTDAHQEKKKTGKTIFLSLAASTLWLLPPIYNILRAILIVYIPMFGLTEKRLLGIYTTVAFAVAMAVLFYGVYKKHKHLFIHTALSFWASLAVCIFVLPTNLIIMTHAMYQYTSGKKIDVNYTLNLPVQKWAWYFYSNLPPSESTPTDMYIGRTLALSALDYKKAQTYDALIIAAIRKDIKEIVEAIESQNMAKLREFLGTRDNLFIYNGEPIPGITIEASSNIENFKDEDFFVKNPKSLEGTDKFLPPSRDLAYTSMRVHVRYKKDGKMLENTGHDLYVDFSNAKGPHVLSISSNLLPFFVSAQDQSCELIWQKLQDTCNTYKNTHDGTLQEGEIPKEIVSEFFDNLIRALPQPTPTLPQQPQNRQTQR